MPLGFTMAQKFLGYALIFAVFWFRFIPLCHQSLFMEWGLNIAKVLIQVFCLGGRLAKHPHLLLPWGLLSHSSTDHEKQVPPDKQNVLFTPFLCSKEGWKALHLKQIYLHCTAVVTRTLVLVGQVGILFVYSFRRKKTHCIIRNQFWNLPEACERVDIMPQNLSMYNREWFENKLFVSVGENAYYVIP